MGVEDQLILCAEGELDRLQDSVLDPRYGEIENAEDLLVQEYRVEREHGAV